jgi:glycosyltransferase involved in cell wall biosynthesis
MNSKRSDNFEKDLVSVCIPSYNHAPFLAQAIDSVLAQTHRPLELIVTDDGSTDGSLAVAEEYAARQPDLVRVCTHPGRSHRGISATANRGFEEAQGEFWSGLPSDDVFHPRKLELEVAFLRANPECGFVYGRALRMDLDGVRIPGSPGGNVNSADDPLVALILKNKIPAMTVLARRQVMAEAGLHAEGLVFSDWEIWIRLLARHPCGFIDLPLATQRVHATNTSVGIPARDRLTHELVVLDHLKQTALRAPGTRLDETRIRALLHLRSADLLYLLGERAEAETELRRSLRADASLGQDIRLLARWLALRRRVVTGDSSEAECFVAWFVAALQLAPPDRRRLSRYARAFELRRAAGDRSTTRGSALARARWAFHGLLLDPLHYATTWWKLPPRNAATEGRGVSPTQP